jgi:hypothetical protein
MWFWIMVAGVVLFPYVVHIGMWIIEAKYFKVDYTASPAARGGDGPQAPFFIVSVLPFINYFTLLYYPFVTWPNWHEYKTDKDALAARVIAVAIDPRRNQTHDYV